MIRRLSRYLLLLFPLLCPAGHAEQEELLFTIARLQYKGGGDWYSDPSSLPNLLRFVREHTRINATTEEARVQIMDEELFSYPYIYMTGHGNITFAPEELTRLRHYLESGGFLHADDNYGMDQYFRQEIIYAIIIFSPIVILIIFNFLSFGRASIWVKKR